MAATPGGPEPAGGHARRRGGVLKQRRGGILADSNDGRTDGGAAAEQSTVLRSERESVQERGCPRSLLAATRAAPPQLIAKQLDDARQRLQRAEE